MTEFAPIDVRFNGPPGIGQGGYVSGLLASLIGGPSEVSLRSPAPLQRALDLEHRDDGSVMLLDGETLVAEGRGEKDLNLDVPEPVDHPRRSVHRPVTSASRTTCSTPASVRPGAR